MPSTGSISQVVRLLHHWFSQCRQTACLVHWCSQCRKDHLRHALGSASVDSACAVHWVQLGQKAEELSFLCLQPLHPSQPCSPQLNTPRHIHCGLARLLQGEVWAVHTEGPWSVFAGYTAPGTTGGTALHPKTGGRVSLLTGWADECCPDR